MKGRGIDGEFFSSGFSFQSLFLKKIQPMFEVTIRTDNEAALQKLLEFISTVGFQIVGQKRSENGKTAAKKKKPAPPEPPITWAKEPDVLAMAGIWEGKKLDAEEIRKMAWGDRL